MTSNHTSTVFSITLKAFLDARATNYSTLVHMPAGRSHEISLVRDKAGAPKSVGAKALLISPKNAPSPSMIIIPADKSLCSRSLRKQVGKFSFSSPETLLEVTGLRPGTVPPFGAVMFPSISELYVDEDLFLRPQLAFNAGSLTESIFLTGLEYQRLIAESAIIGNWSK